MKKNLVSLPVVAMCLALSSLAFALPIYANVGMSSETGKVMKVETPKEYMQDFTIEGKQQKGQLVDSIFLSEAQISDLKTAAAKSFKETLGIEVPSNLKFEYRTIPSDGIRIGLSWLDEKESASKDGVMNKDGVLYFADFHMADTSKAAVLNTIGVKNGYDAKKLDGLKKQAIDALKKEVKATVPDNYFVSTRVIVNFLGKNQDINVQFEWSKSKKIDMLKDTSACSYVAGFDKVDLSKNQGRLNAIENTEATFMANANAAKFTSIQETNMLEAAKTFLNQKEIGFGKLISSMQMGNVLWFTFDSVTDNKSDRAVIDVYIGSDLNVTGYIF